MPRWTPALLVTLLCLPLLGAGRGLRGVRPPEPVSTSRSPWDHLVPFPPFHGSSSPLDAAADSRREVRFSYTADLSGLEAIEDTKALSRHLAADPRWRVTELHGAFVALLRAPLEDTWTVSRLGFHQEEGRAWRILVRFSDWDPGHVWADAPTITVVDTRASSFDVQAFFSSQRPWHDKAATDVVVRASRLALEVYEVGPQEPRTATDEALELARTYLPEISTTAVATRGYDLMHLEALPTAPEPWLVLEVPHHNEVRVRGCSDPGEPGWTWVRLLDSSGEPWNELPVSVGSREMVGWGTEAGACFPFEGRFPAPTADGFTGRAEIWFQAMGGGAPRKLAAFEAHFPPR